MDPAWEPIKIYAQVKLRHSQLCIYLKFSTIVLIRILLIRLFLGFTGIKR